MSPKDSDALNDSQNPSEEIEVLAGIADTFKLDEKKEPAVNEQVAKIVRGLMREKLSEDVLTDTQNRYKRPENCDCLETTKINHLIWDKLKPETRSVDIKLQRIQRNLIKGVIPLVSIIQELVNARDKVPSDALDISQIVKMTTDAIALIGAANFELNMRRREQIKPELNEDYKNLCSSSVPFTDSLFGNDSDSDHMVTKATKIQNERVWLQAQSRATHSLQQACKREKAQPPLSKAKAEGRRQK